MNLWKGIKEFFRIRSDKSTRKRAKINRFQISKQEEDEAVQFLVENIPSKIWKDFSQNPGKFLSDHRGFGMFVRNLLRSGGFNWGPIELDEKWADLVRKAYPKVSEEAFAKPRCDYCGKIIEGLPCYNRWGKKFCADHKVPETRCEQGADHLPKEYVTIEHSDGTIEIRK
jgi:hypothetical protein